MIRQTGACKKCFKIKTRQFAGVKNGRTAFFEDDNKKVWNGKTCPDCIISNKPVPKPRPDKILGTVELNTCQVCKEKKVRVLTKVYSGGSCRYEDDKGKRWTGNVCDGCYKIRRKVWKRERGGKNLEIVDCFECGESFKQKTVWAKYCSGCKKIKPRPLIHCPRCNKEFPQRNTNHTFCSVECWRNEEPKEKSCLGCSRSFKNNKRKYCTSTCRPKTPSKYVKKQYTEKACLHCHRTFQPNSLRHNYCKHSCTPAKRNAKKRDKSYRQYKTPISKKSKKEIIHFYEQCPVGMSVDHIVPRNGKIVSGLHVIVNLQYLSIEDNTKKNAKFDGTRDNLSWKKK